MVLLFLFQDRTVVIATYALCGFSNITSIGIMLGALGAMAPARKRDITKIVVRAMIAGNVACFMTACIAGTFLFHIDLSLGWEFGALAGLCFIIVVFPGYYEADPSRGTKQRRD